MTTADTATCTRCGRPVADLALACNPCIDLTRDNLGYIAYNAGEIDTATARQSRFAPSNGPRSTDTEAPLPVNLYASDVGHRLRSTLTTWTRLVAEERGVSIDEAFPRSAPSGHVCARGDGSWCTHRECRSHLGQPITNRDMALWLRGRLGWIAHREWGPTCFGEIGRAAVDLGRAIDTPPPMISLGRCDTEGCEGELRAHQEAAWVKCRDCGESYDVAKRKDQLVSRASHITMTAVKLARVLTAARIPGPDGQPVECKEKDVHNWVQRRNLLKRGTDARTGRPTYSFSVAWALHEKRVQRLFEKAAKNADRLASQAA